MSWADEVEYDIVNQKAPSTLPPLNDYNPPVSLSYPAEHPDVSANLEGKLAELGISDDTTDYVADWEQDVPADAVPTETNAIGASESLWDNYEEEQKPSKDVIRCEDHGRVCKKGICQTYSRQLAVQRRKEQMANNPIRGKGSGRGAGKGKGRKGGGRGRSDQVNDWRGGSDAGSRSSHQAGTRNANGVTRNPSSSSTPLGGSSADDDDEPPAASDSKDGRKGRTRSDSIQSSTTAASSVDGWGAISNGPW